MRTSASDHNIVGIIFRVSGTVRLNQAFKKRKWDTFNLELYREKVDNITWENMYEMSNVNLALDFFESSLNTILKYEAPIMKIHPSGRYKTWVQPNTKLLITERDNLRNVAKANDDIETWQKYRKLRNKVTKEVTNDRKKYFKDKYDECEATKDQAKLYKTAKSQLGWSMSGPPISTYRQGWKHNIISPIIGKQANELLL